MSDSRGGAASPRRRRDADGTRAALLKAGAELFAERGYDHATTRDIGERAGVDAAMIARYFGGKAQLYIAVLREEMGDDVPVDILDPARMRHLVDRAVRRGPSPIYRVAIRPHDDPRAQAASRAELHRRIVGPLTARLAADGVDRPQEKAEVLTAAFIGVLTARASGAFDRLPDLSADDLTSLLLELLPPQH
ncbi:transcriptional regulator, TetR family [Micromonospora purpureochromogenes]|jgi:AcrR family transcriptional regulator|uniref:Transcriptional regulator, TetR family n=1 Tax=Micromonospora purpureochromogenes TaxID=47872 RepID=A0A1C4XLF6_9ACTN|nr:TetR/AcrR family transcriptional regulator [Micromonospora purpureochromogenes]SCF09287.1 transcriptional regulator, TetR family [Micromonospora purpureochromogenes]